MERNVFKMIDVTQFMLIESTGDSEAKSPESDLINTTSFSSRPNFFTQFDDNNDDDDDDAESCSYGSLLSGSADRFSHDDDDDDDDGMMYDDDNHEYDDEMEEDDDSIDSKMVEVSKKCEGFVMGTRQKKRSKDCSSMELLNIEKEKDKNFWEICLAS